MRHRPLNPKGFLFWIGCRGAIEGRMVGLKSFGGSGCGVKLAVRA